MIRDTEKIEFIDRVLVNTFPWKENLKNLLIHKLKRGVENMADVTICDDSLGNDYVCMFYKDKTIHSLFEVRNEQVIDELYDLCLWLKED